MHTYGEYVPDVVDTHDKKMDKNAKLVVKYGVMNHVSCFIWLYIRVHYILKKVTANSFVKNVVKFE
jgi:hypothetical protein